MLCIFIHLTVNQFVQKSYVHHGWVLLHEIGIQGALVKFPIKIMYLKIISFQCIFDDFLKVWFPGPILKIFFQILFFLLRNKN